ncbi:MAG: futalosine hydrolase [Jatrophihabitantaceae bacterium]
MPRLLIVTAVAAERAAVLAGRDPATGAVTGQQVHRCQTGAGLVDVGGGGVGAVSAALSTAALLAGASYDLVISAGIGGGFAGVELGATVLADLVVQADLGAETADGGFSSLTELGMGPVELEPDPALTGRLADRTGARVGSVLTVATVTGTAERAQRLQASYPNALAEAMEGAGVALAAARAGVPFAEVRTISNRVGPRDRSSWQLPAALAALSATFELLLAEPLR